jgi:tRNA pseudouridine32 synthase/23S rRNA pseudouridine746 synthase
MVMAFDDPCFTAPIEMYTLPEHFSFPFYYQPHPLCIFAAQQLQGDLVSQNQWQHNFGLLDDPHNIIGEKLGVLLVENVQGELGFISDFSGKLAQQNHIYGFVRPVFGLLTDDSFFLSTKLP